MFHIISINYKMKKLLLIFVLFAISYSYGYSCQRSQNEFRLTFSWACRSGVNFDSCRGTVIWNGVHLEEIRPCNYHKNIYTAVVKARVG